jgi:hypothetical protein
MIPVKNAEFPDLNMRFKHGFSWFYLTTCLVNLFEMILDITLINKTITVRTNAEAYPLCCTSGKGVAS